jgi:protease I
MKNDLTRAGATFVDEPPVVDGNIITARYPGDLPQFLAAVSAQFVAGELGK